jgi:hypothetical protein
MPKRKKFLARVQKTSFCPRCGKRFANETRVLQHLNQPSSACGAFLNDFSSGHPEPTPQTIKAPEPPGPGISATRQLSPETFDDMEVDLDYPGPLYDERWQMDTDDDNQQLGTEPQDPSGSGTAHLGNVEDFPGASQIYPGGRTFMDEFFSDQYELRKENLFYPFASQQDWQVASWLLRSRLSMAAIDSFLSLDLVRYTSSTS